MEGKKSNRGLVVALIVFVVLSIGLGGYLVYDKVNVPDNSINKRLYSVDSDMRKQRYYLLLDDATYGMDENFLDRKTYILDLNMTDGNQIVKEVDLSSLLTPIANEYIDNEKGNNTGVFSVEYFTADTGTDWPQIDYEKEVAFSVYYRCVNGDAETSLGSVVYAYNVETDTIRNLGSVD